MISDHLHCFFPTLLARSHLLFTLVDFVVGGWQVGLLVRGRPTTVDLGVATGGRRHRLSAHVPLWRRQEGPKITARPFLLFLSMSSIAAEAQFQEHREEKEAKEEDDGPDRGSPDAHPRVEVLCLIS